MSDNQNEIEQLVSKLYNLGFHLKSETAAMVLSLHNAAPKSSPQAIGKAVSFFLARSKAILQFGAWAAEGQFSPHGVEQASRARIAEHHARKFSNCGTVLEIGTGMGSDTAALARVCRRVVSIELDEETAEMARYNLAIQELTNVSIITGRAEEIVPTLNEEFDGVFADPSRRTLQGERISDPERYHPPFSFLTSLAIGTVRGIKIGPAVDLPTLPGGWSREFLGLDDECLEQTLWFGAGVADCSATLIDHALTWFAPPAASKCPVTENLSGYLVEPHGSLIRTGRLAAFYAEHGISLMDRHIAYGISVKSPTPTPFLAAFEIIEHGAYHPRRLAQRLQELRWNSRTEIKKRAFNQTPEKVRALLDLPKPSIHRADFGVIFLTRWQEKPWYILARRIG